MMTIRAFSLLLLLVSHVSYAQSSLKDSSAYKEKPMSLYNFFNTNTNLPDYIFNKELAELKLNASFINDSTSIMIRTRMQLGSFFNNSLEAQPNNYLSSYYQNYLAEDKYKIVKQILGAVQMGAVGYLAYLHLTKYGFLKKKND